MAEMATNVGTVPRTIIANVTLVRGLRVIINSSATADLAGSTVRGDFVTAVDIVAAAAGAAYQISQGKVAAQASGVANVGDLAYSAASGQFGTSSANTALLGRWTLGASGANVLGEVELFAVA